MIDLPQTHRAETGNQLLTLAAVLFSGAVVLGVLAPGRYGIDPIGTGEHLGLDAVFLSRLQLPEFERVAPGPAEPASLQMAPAIASAVEAVPAAPADPAGDETRLAEGAPIGLDSPPASPLLRSEVERQTATRSIALAPGARSRVALDVARDDRVLYQWRSVGGSVAVSLDSTLPGIDSASWRAGGGEGAVSAPAEGALVWQWHNVGSREVVLTFEAQGYFRSLALP